MRIQIRPCVWETNSSTTHAYAELSEFDFEKWKNGDCYLFLGNDAENENGDKAKPGVLYTEEEVFGFVKYMLTYYRWYYDFYGDVDKASYDDIICYSNECGFFNYKDYVRADDISLIEPTKHYTVVRTWYQG